MQEDEVLFTEFFNQKLKEQGLTLKQLSQSTGIAMKHLESFSHGRFERLPSAPYVHGYFMKLGAIMDFDPDEWWSRIKEEDSVHKSGPNDRMPDNRFSRFRGRALLGAGIIILLALIYFGARFTTILGEPQIFVTEPRADVTEPNCVRESILAVRGTVRNGDTLSIGGDSVPLGPEGEFSADVALSPGSNTIEVRAQKILGREAVVTRQVCYDAAQIILPAPDAELPSVMPPASDPSATGTTPTSTEPSAPTTTPVF
jgi:hypothetical protein